MIEQIKSEAQDFMNRQNLTENSLPNHQKSLSFDANNNDQLLRRDSPSYHSSKSGHHHLNNTEITFFDAEADQPFEEKIAIEINDSGIMPSKKMSKKSKLLSPLKNKKKSPSKKKSPTK